MTVLIISSFVEFGGRGKALLSLADYLSQEFDVIIDNYDGPSFNKLSTHHGIQPDVTWGRPGGYSPDVVIGFDSKVSPELKGLDVPTVAYCRRGINNWADEYWSPSKTTAERHNAWLRKHDEEDNCHAVYPTWYIEKSDSVQPFDEREIDVLLHRRKSEGVDLSDYSTHYAELHPWDELTEYYNNSKIFLFPTKPRFEPLGMMPIEAAAFGCHIALPRNSGVAEIYPQHVYREPHKAIDELLASGETTDISLPESPTDPIQRILSLIHGPS